MSAEAHAHEEEHHHSPWFYTVIAVVLGLITLVELGPLFEWFNLPVIALVVLSVAKFALVVALFMHLADDENVFSWIFAPPLAGGVAMVSVLMMLAHSFAPSPADDVIPVEQRQWANYSGECSSWLRSHVSNKWYCASPQISRDRLIAYAGKAAPAAAGGSAEPDLSTMSADEAKAQLIADGEGLYGTHCVACHQATGQGVPGAFPPLAGTDFIDDPAKHAKIIVNGLSGEIVVNGTTYNSAMTPFGQLSDYEIAAIATYERNSWGNDLGVVEPSVVASVR